MPQPRRHVFLACALVLSVSAAFAETPRVSHISSPQEFLGFQIGDDYHVANYTQLEAYWKKLASESDRLKLVDIGPTAEGRRQWMAIVSAPANLKKLDYYRGIAAKLAKAEGVSEVQARDLAREGKAVVWIDGGLHATETVGSQQLIEQVYEMLSRSDPEILRFLNDTIQLYVLANPDGQEMVANWYMREPDPKKRSTANLPQLYEKYAGHDNNRDFYMANLPETANMNRQMFEEWFPEIVYDHHQTGPAGTVIFMPPFRDPFNYNLDPQIPLQIEMLGASMHSRLVAEGKPGSTMRSGSSYSTWWNGGLRTIAYFHNSIGILSEIIGNPTPMEIPLVPDKQLAAGDLPMPVAPQTWRYRQSIEYEMTNNRAVLDYASKNRESLLFNIWRMGMNSIEKGSGDSWTVTPRRVEALKAAAGKNPRVDAKLYNSILQDPAHRDPRGYIIPANQADWPTAREFVNALLRNGITVLRAASGFTVNGKAYPAGSFVVKTAQAFRPHVLDMFEPQDHPNDFKYPGGPPVPPYDITGWTLAMQMGVEFDRVLDGFDGPFVPVGEKLPSWSGSISGNSDAGGYLISHRANVSFTLLNRLLKGGAEVYWLKRGSEPGAMWVPRSTAAAKILHDSAATLGLNVTALAERPTGPALKLKPVRIGLVDRYGGLIASGWTRFVLERFEFPYQVVYAPDLDAGNLRAKFDVLVFPDGAFGGNNRGPNADSVPDQYRAMVGRITPEATVPQLKKFVETGGSVVTLGNSTDLADLLGVNLKSQLVKTTAEGKEQPLDREDFYVPGSLLKARIDNTQPLAYGMPENAYVFFDNNPVFKLNGDGPVKKVGWFEGTDLLGSGWAWGQRYLNGGTAVAEAGMGEGKVVLLGPEITFRGQSYGTFKLLFNAIYYGSAVDANVE